MAKEISTFRFRKTDQIGAAGAEEDAEFLHSCFVDTGDLALLENLSDHRVIVVGRTGSGKSALLAKLADGKGENAISISPESLALTYVTNSTVLNFFTGLGVNLDPFFKLLWRHVLTVELLSHHFAQHGNREQKSLLDRLRAMFSGPSRLDKKMSQAVEYLEEWGKSFWLETEYRVKEITRKVETALDTELRARLGSKAAGIGSSIRTAEKLTDSERAELLSRGQDVISKAQVRDLHQVIELLDSVLADRQKGYYIVIDGLDENWVEERLRYKLIMALIQTARDFLEVDNAKVILALRRDLMERVFRLTRDSGFQEEKYQSLYLPLAWTRGQLLEVLDRRIGQLVARRYTKQRVAHRDVLPRQFRKMPIDRYIFSVTRLPRDVIAFFNTCIVTAADLAKLGSRELKIAEGEYSRSRLRALGDEWSGDYPGLLDFAMILQRRPASFKIKTMNDREIEELCLRTAIEIPGGRGMLQQHGMRVVECVLSAADFKVILMQIFYHVGLVGLKPQPHEAESWVDEPGKSISSAEISGNTSVVVHPTYRRALGVVE